MKTTISNKEKFNEIYKKENRCETAGLGVMKLLICLFDFSLLILGMRMAENESNPPIIRFAGAILVLAVGIIYVIVNVKYLSSGGWKIGKFLFKILIKNEEFKFYNDYNTGVIK